MDAIQGFVEQVKTLALGISGSLAVIGFVGVAAMYLLSPIPVVSEWKQNNPKAFSNVVIGLLLLMFAGSGGIALVLGF